MKLFWCAALLCCLSDCMVNYMHPRVIGQEITEVDRESMQKIEYPNDIKDDEIVAANYQGQWLYARVQLVPKVPLWMGLVNWQSADPKDMYGGRAINYKRHVRKLLTQVALIKRLNTQAAPLKRLNAPAALIKRLKRQRLDN